VSPKYLKEITERTVFVGMKSGMPLTNRALTEFIAYRLERLGTQRIAPHRLRASAATHMVGAGMHIGFVQQILGHERLDTTRIYVQIHAGELKAILERSHPRATFKKGE